MEKKNIDLLYLTGYEYPVRYSAYGILMEEEKILLVKTPNGIFLPGGKIEENESDIDCLKREYIEETGIEIEIVKYIGKSVQMGIEPITNNHIRIYGSFYFVGKTGNIYDPLEKDHSNIWMKREDAAGALKLEFQSSIIKQWRYL